MRDMMIALLIGIALGLAAGLGAGYKLWHQEPRTTAETFRPGKVQADGSVDLARIPTAPADAGPAPHVLPPKAKETSRAHIKVVPKPVPVEPGQTTCSCDPITIDLSSYTSPGGTGIVASADGAEVDVAHSTYTPMLDPAPRYDRYLEATTEPGREAYSLQIGRRYLGGRLGLSIGGAKQPGDTVRPLVGVQINW